MSENHGYERLEFLFKRSGTLPPLPATVMRLIRVIDTGEASAIDLERVVTCDPALTADLLRAASLMGTVEAPITTVRGAIMRLGQRTVRSVGTSLLINDMVKKYRSVPGFDPVALARHSLFVGFMSRYLFARRHSIETFETRWSADEVFAAGVMHDLSVGVMAMVSPAAVTRVATFARRAHKSFVEGFELIFENPLNRLGALACNTWGLPDIFETTQRYFDSPWEHEDELTALYCMSYANYLADANGFALESWEFEPSVFPEIKLEVGLQDEEIANAVEVVGKLTRTALETSYAAA
ncbi:MAG: hypothetical protein AMXMBFR81_04320 [Chthonomonas sp.]|nr:HDOD domain-containing protein [Fimbriimonadaceae bacterium]